MSKPEMVQAEKYENDEYKSLRKSYIKYINCKSSIFSKLNYFNFKN